MKLSIALLSSIFLATTTLAAPRISRRQLPQNLTSIANITSIANTTASSGGTKVRTFQSLPKQISTKNSKAKGNTSHTDYSSNWGGAVIKAPPAGQTFNAVSGAFTVPTPSIPSNGMGTGEAFAAAVWVGIDGDT
jgi:Peptidase A4 family